MSFSKLLRERCTGIYRARHGAVQQAYCETKGALLAEYVATCPHVVPNYGWGKESCVFSTLSLPSLSFIRDLCYRPNPEKPGYWVKTVTPEWLAQLTWEGIAWWYQDDGGVSKRSPSVTISTHSFPEEQVRLLAAWLTEKGAPAQAARVKKGAKIYWIVKLTVEASEKFLHKTRPYAHPSMLYKFPKRAEQTCCWCGTQFPVAGGNSKIKPCCPKPECRHKTMTATKERYAHKPGQAQKRWQRQKATLTATDRQRRNEQEAERMKDPAYAKRWETYRANYAKANRDRINARRRSKPSSWKPRTPEQRERAKVLQQQRRLLRKQVTSSPSV